MNGNTQSMKRIAVILLTSISTLTFADLGPAKIKAGKIEIPENQNYKFQADLSYLLNSSHSNGKSNNKENLAANLLFQRQVGIWGQELKAEAVSANDDGDARNNVERYMLSGKVLHRSTDTIYQYAKLQGDKDLSSSFDYQVALTGGAGIDVVKTIKQELTAEAGAGYRYSKINHDSSRNASNDYKELIGSVGVFYQYKFNDIVKFNQDVGYDFGDKSQTLRSRTSMSANLTTSVSGLVSYQIKNLQADSGNSRDSLLSVGLRYRH